MGVLGGCAAVALMWWAQAPLPDALERPAEDQPQPGQLIHPLVLQVDGPVTPPDPPSAEPAIAHEPAPPIESPAAPESTPEQAATDEPVFVPERPQILQSRPIHPLALDLPAPRRL